MTNGSCGHVGEAGVPLLPQWERHFDPFVNLIVYKIVFPNILLRALLGDIKLLAR